MHDLIDQAKESIKANPLIDALAIGGGLATAALVWKSEALPLAGAAVKVLAKDGGEAVAKGLEEGAPQVTKVLGEAGGQVGKTLTDTAASNTAAAAHDIPSLVLTESETPGRFWPTMSNSEQTAKALPELNLRGAARAVPTGRSSTTAWSTSAWDTEGATGAGEPSSIRLERYLREQKLAPDARLWSQIATRSAQEQAPRLYAKLPGPEESAWGPYWRGEEYVSPSAVESPRPTANSGQTSKSIESIWASDPPTPGAGPTAELRKEPGMHSTVKYPTVQEEAAMNRQYRLEHPLTLTQKWNRFLKSVGLPYSP
jgi:hypothetical protein